MQLLMLDFITRWDGIPVAPGLIQILKAPARRHQNLGISRFGAADWEVFEETN